MFKWFQRLFPQLPKLFYMDGQFWDGHFRPDIPQNQKNLPEILWKKLETILVISGSKIALGQLLKMGLPFIN